MRYLKSPDISKIFNKRKLKDDYLKELFEVFWVAPCDAFLRSPEIAIWKEINFISPTLNIGCRDGRMDKYLFNGKRIDIAIDNDRKTIGLAKKSGLYKKTVLTSASKMPFKDNSISTVISNSTFEHIKYDLESIREVFRVLKKGGRFIFTTTNSRYPKTLRNLRLNDESISKYNKRASHYHYRSIDEWKDILKRTGFSKVVIRTYGPDNWMRSWLLLFRLTTIKPYKRELWSYLQDSPYGKLFPRRLISEMYYRLFRKIYKTAFKEPGNWTFMYSEK